MMDCETISRLILFKMRIYLVYLKYAIGYTKVTMEIKGGGGWQIWALGDGAPP